MNWPKKDNDKGKYKDKDNDKKKFSELHQRAILETCDLSDIWSEWQGHMTRPKKDNDKNKYKDKDNDNEKDKYI